MIFAEILQKLNEIQQNLQKSGKIPEMYAQKNCNNPAIFEIGAMQKNANLIDLKK